ncbi:glycosyltransferase [Rhodopila sp.]|uniref:glycosyltransferase n=1 Tax=Rhodopila sp. TaxID=2480087 RepID=UPI003D114FF6
MASDSPEPSVVASEAASQAGFSRLAAAFVDPAWYLVRHPDIAAANIEPVRHFILHGADEKRDPNGFFDSAWYAGHYPDVATSGLNPLQHYLWTGAAELRNPHPRFDAVYYVNEHPEAADNPLLHHLQVGQALGYPTEKPFDIRDYLASRHSALPLPRKLVVDVIILVSGGLEETRRCIAAVLADQGKPLGQVIVVDDRSPEPSLIGWLRQCAADRRIHLIRNPRKVGLIASVNRGIQAAGDHDVVVLNTDMVVPAELPPAGLPPAGLPDRAAVPDGWLRRLAAQAYARPGIATVSPFSNTATICGYPDRAGGPTVFGQTAAQLDQACRTANRGRSIDVPTTLLFCMYMRRQALREVGLFDSRHASLGFGADKKFCLRATAMGWGHRLACDIFVHHQGSVSGGNRSERASSGLHAASTDMCNDSQTLGRTLAQHVALDAVAPSRFAVTAALFRASNLPVILMISHGLGGGVRRHIDGLVERYRDTARILLLEGTSRGAALSLPLLPEHPVLTLPADQIDDLVIVLRSMNLSRVHVHHLVRMDIDIRRLIHRLGVPFDVTVHDYYAICPQINLLPWPESLYCGEPDVAGCNACIAHNPGAHDARDIVSWRRERVWQFQEAEHVICPSADVKTRLQRHGLDARAIVVPHEHATAAECSVAVEKPSGPSPRAPLRIGLLGALANHKGSRAVAALAEAAAPGTLEIHLIGYLEDTFPQPAARLIKQTGRYNEEDLPRLLRKVRPHVVWLPSSAPETYSYTLSAAIAAGLPIVATKLGSFPERLAGRPFSWLVDHRASTNDWIAVFHEVRRALREHTGKSPAWPRQPGPDFYDDRYLVPRPQPVPTGDLPAARLRGGRPPAGRPLVGLSAKPIIAIVPERFDNGALSPCAYIRLLQPLDHPAIGDGFRLMLADADSVLDCQADIIVTQRYALPDIAAADALAAHARRTGATLLFDLDDDLLNIPRTHPDARELRPRANVVRRMLDHADVVWVSTPNLAERLSSIREDAVVIENGLDERIWNHADAPPPLQVDPVRFLCMGTSTHDSDFAMIAPALGRLKAEYGDRVSVDVLGMTSQTDLPAGVNRIGTSIHARQSYPGFVHWMNSVRPAWHIGLAPLLDTPFNRSKSAIKAMDYAAMGMVVMASDTPVYQGSITDGPAGQLVPNDAGAWYEALAWMVRDQDLRRSIALRSRAAFLARASLASQGQARRDAWMRLSHAYRGITAA